FGLKLPNHVYNNRGLYVWAACTLIRNWIAKGCPKPADDVPEFGSFRAWRRVMGGIMAAAGIEGFLGNLEQPGKDSPQREAFGYLVHEIARHYGQSDWVAADIKTLAEEPNCYAGIDPSQGRGGEKSFDTKLGIFLRKNTNRIIDGWKLVRLPRAHRGGQRYRLKKIKKAA
ncbi:MAG: hypothetical protein ACRDIB_12635, partial [Ardenticatenaceae bacterium]